MDAAAAGAAAGVAANLVASAAVAAATATAAATITATTTSTTTGIRREDSGEEGGLMLGSAKEPLNSPSGGLAHGMQSLPCSFDQFLWQMLISSLLIPPWMPGT